MLTLKELRNMVEVAEVQGRVPTARGLMESGTPIVVKEIVDAYTEIVVYRNGLVLYRVGSHATVFPLHPCAGYSYDTGIKGSPAQDMTIRADFFEQENWYIRLILEGEDRLAINQDVRMGSKTISYSVVAEDWNVLAVEDRELERVIDRETLKELLQMITDNQRYVVTRYYLEDVAQKEIAAELGVSSQAVSDMIRKAMKRIRKGCGVEEPNRKKGDKK